jgi:cell division protein FtsW (lipid II flippase)/cell division protein FtsI/penicillin-binding protein 2
MVVAAVASLTGLGLIMVLAARDSLGRDPLPPEVTVGLALGSVTCGVILALLLRRIGVKQLERFSGPLVVISLALLAACDHQLIGFEIGGRALLRIGGLVIEPGEIVAVALVLLAANRLAVVRFGRELQFQAPIFLFLSGVPFLFLILHASLGTTAIVTVALVAMLLVAGARLGNIVLGAVPLLFVVGFLLLAEPYQSERLLTFLDPWKDFLGSGFQVAQSLITVGSGGLVGRGFGNSVQRAFYLPGAEGNFVLATVAEEFGLFAIFAVLGLVLMLAYAGLRNALRATDRRRTLLVTGLTTLLVGPALINVFMVLGMAPPLLVGLPFVSYGVAGPLVAFGVVGILVAAMQGGPDPAGPPHDRSRVEPSRLNRRRIGLVFAVVLILTAAAALRGSWLDTVRASGLRAQAGAQQTVAEVDPGERGTIFDRHGFPLAVSRPGFDVAANPHTIYEPARALRELPPLLDISRGHLRDALDTESGFVYLVHGLPAAAGEEVRRLNINGIELFPTLIRVRPRGPIASQVDGGVGDEGEGLFGLELSFDHELSGENGVRRTITDALGHPLSRQKPGLPVRGENLKTTLDAGLQEKVEEVLSGVGARINVAHAIALILNTRSSEILASATWPSFDPNRLRQTNPSRLIDQTIGFEYSPGSIVDPFSLVGALAEGRAKLRTTVDTPAGIRIADRVIEGDAPATSATVAQLLRSPNDVGTARIAMRVPPADFTRWIKRFGFGRQTGVSLPGERGGSIPGGHPTAASVASLAVGASQLVTPMQLAAAYCALADRGVLRQPQIVRSVGGDAVEPPQGERIVPQPIANEILDRLGDGGELAATAPVIESRTGEYSVADHNITAVDIVPDRRPQLVEVLVLDHVRDAAANPGLASDLLGEINRFALPYLGIPPD